MLKTIKGLSWPKSVYRLLAAAICCGALGPTSTHAGDVLWKTSLPQAITEASQQNKQVLLYFSGSDWCAPCVKMDQEVLSRKQFADFASKNLILVKLDFPRHKELPPDEKAQNEQLAKSTRFKDSLPSSWLMPLAKRLGARKGTLRGANQVSQVGQR